MAEKPFEIIHLGGRDCVTGSCHLLRASGLNILVDCGMEQGGDAARGVDFWPVKPSEVDYLFVTLAHVDHIGRIPELLVSGFKGEIITTEPTRALLKPMLHDAMSFDRMEERQLSRVESALEDLCWAFEYDATFDLKKGIRFRLRRAGHILGSCTVHIGSETSGWSVLFSGDLGSGKRPILPEADPPDPCDLLVLESTYGDTLHGGMDRRVERLGALLTKALSDRGKVFIPAFALGRVQELIYDLDRLYTVPALKKAFPELGAKRKIPVLIDSPLGLEITKIYSGLKDFWNDEARRLAQAGDHPIDFDVLYAVRQQKDHMKVLEMDGPVIIIAGSGMCTGGRIVDHLKEGLENPKNDVVFVGYQADGAPGRAILEAGKRPGTRVRLDGEEVAVRARIHSLSGYSAHADQDGLVKWVELMDGRPGEIRLVHGDPSARKALSERLKKAGYAVSL